MRFTYVLLSAAFVAQVVSLPMKGYLHPTIYASPEIYAAAVHHSTGPRPSSPSSNIDDVPTPHDAQLDVLDKAHQAQTSKMTGHMYKASDARHDIEHHRKRKGRLLRKPGTTAHADEHINDATKREKESVQHLRDGLAPLIETHEALLKHGRNALASETDQQRRNELHSAMGFASGRHANVLKNLEAIHRGRAEVGEADDMREKADAARREQTYHTGQYVAV